MTGLLDLYLDTIVKQLHNKEASDLIEVKIQKDLINSFYESFFGRKRKRKHASNLPKEYCHPIAKSLLTVLLEIQYLGEEIKHDRCL